MNKNKVFMAFATGRESTEGPVIKRYIGLAPVHILGVNPNKVELEKLYGTELKNNPEYTGLVEDRETGNKVPYARVDFIVQNEISDKYVDAEGKNISMVTRISFFLRKEFRKNRDGSKVQVINKYGETTWLSIEDAKNGVIPESLSWFEPADFRPAFVGEEELTNFMKAYLNVPNKSYRKATGEVVELENKSEAEARLDKVEKYFTGDVSELRTLVNYQPNNKVKALFGVRTTDDNTMYQDVYIQKFYRNNVTNYAKLDAEIQERKAQGAYPSTEFEICDLKEYVVGATDFASELPFSANDSVASPWSK